MKIRALRLGFSGLFVFGFSLAAGAQSQIPPASNTGTRPRIVNATPSPASQQQKTTTQTPPATVPSPTVPRPQPAISNPATANPSIVTPTTVPTVPFAQPAPLKPTTPLAINKARARIDEAQRLFKTRLVPTALGSPTNNPALAFVTVAALDQDTSQIHLITLSKQTFLTKDAEVTMTTSLGKLVRLRVVRPNYVNTAVVVSDLQGRQLTPLLVEYPIEKQGAFREMAYYTSAHPALLSPDVVKNGQAYVRTMLDLAAKRLKDKGVSISPQIIDVAERLCVVEHVDHQRFRTESRLALYEEVYALFALNELNTYRYSVSWAGAGGMVQMIPPTYQMVRRLHPGVGLNPDFVFGMRNHGNALEAMLLYMQDTWNDLLSRPDINYALNAKLATQTELLAAGYNSNPARLALYIRRGDAAWRTLIPRETQIYLQIYRSVEGLIPLKPRT